MAKFEERDPRWLVADRPDGTNVNAWHWQEKNMFSWLKGRLSELMKNAVAHQDAESKITLQKLDSVEGDCTLQNRKGKKFFLYDLHIKSSWEIEFRDGDKVKKATGTVKLIECMQDDDDWDSEVNIVDADKSIKPKVDLLARVYAVRATKDALRTVTNELREMTKMTREVPGGTGAAPTAPAKEVPAASAQQQPAVQASAGPKPTATGATADVKIEEMFSCSPADLFAALLEAPRIAAYTQAQARVERSVGGSFELLGGSITGTFLELKDNSRIVERWRMSSWPAGHDSIVTMDLEETRDGTRLRLTQQGVPKDEEERTRVGWKTQWHRLKMIFGYGA